MLTLAAIIALLSYLIITVATSGHAISVTITLYLHRQLTHGSVKFRNGLTVIMRLWIWLHAGINRCQWVAVHVYHHITSDTPDDPHSPQQYGTFCVPPDNTIKHRPIWPLRLICPQGFGLFWTNLKQYLKAARNPEIVNKYGQISQDWLERKVTGRLFWLGPFVLLPLLHIFLSACLFYLIGVSLWWSLVAGPLVMIGVIVWTIYSQAFVNSYGHAGLIRDARTHDYSVDIRGGWLKNLILNWVVVGEQIHHGHHTNQKKWNFGKGDLGGLYIKILVRLGLASVQR